MAVSDGVHHGSSAVAVNHIEVRPVLEHQVAHHGNVPIGRGKVKGCTLVVVTIIHLHIPAAQHEVDLHGKQPHILLPSDETWLNSVKRFTVREEACIDDGGSLCKPDVEEPAVQIVITEDQVDGLMKGSLLHTAATCRQ